MWRFYWSLIREIPRVFRDTTEAWTFWIVSIAAPLAVLLNPQLQSWINTPPFSRWFVFAPIAVSVVYGMARVNYARFSTLTTERDDARLQLEHRAAPITRDDWMDMSRQFAALRDRKQPALYEPPVLATWSQAAEGESWALNGPTEILRELQALCKRAGAMLLKSPNVAAKLSPKVLAYEDPVNRWLEFLRTQPRVEPRFTGSGIVYGTATKSETFESLAALSAVVCVSCSAEEI